MSTTRHALILGAAGRDFHNFNVYFRSHAGYRVVGFTAAQIPHIDNRVYPAALAGPRYPQGIRIYPEAELPWLIRRLGVTDVFFCYSDVSHAHVMQRASIALAHGASFSLLGPHDTMLPTQRPVVAVVGARTGAGKSTLARYLFAALRRAGRRPVAVRHPMPYGDLTRGVQRYARAEDLLGAGLSVEEMEEYQQHVDQGGIVYAGVDYAAILERAESEGDVILWDGGNNDMPFYRPTVTVTVLDALRPGEAGGYFPGEVNLRAADILVIGKVNAAESGAVEQASAAARALNAQAPIVAMESVESVDHPERVRGKRVLVVEDGPSVTHGGLREAVGARAARLLDATAVDPRPYAVGSLAQAFEAFPQLGAVLPALGYDADQMRELQDSINRVPCDAVLLGTPADLGRVLRIDKPVARVRFEARDTATPTLADRVLERLREAA